MQFVGEYLRWKLLERIAPRGDERATSVLAAKCCLGKPTGESRVHDPCPDFPTLRTEMGDVLVMDLPVLPPGYGLAGAEELAA